MTSQERGAALVYTDTPIDTVLSPFRPKTRRQWGRWFAAREALRRRIRGQIEGTTPWPDPETCIEALGLDAPTELALMRALMVKVRRGGRWVDVWPGPHPGVTHRWHGFAPLEPPVTKPEPPVIDEPVPPVVPGSKRVRRQANRQPGRQPAWARRFRYGDIDMVLVRQAIRGDDNAMGRLTDKERVAAAGLLYKKGHSISNVARRIGVHQATAQAYVETWQHNQHITERPAA
jgi:hypothetical protein